ncbi:MAG: flagellar basal-body MS-ring/collar protein FliF [Hyphomicrobiaceae bacterium]
MIGREQLERLWSSLLALGGRRLAAMGLVGLAVFAAVGLGSYYLSRPQLEAIYTGLTPQDVSRIGAALREAGIHFDVNAQGTAVLVRYGQTAQARMLLAEKGLPSSATAGYELFDKMGSMGLTSFMQEVTRVRALEGEIARTVQAMKGVKAARVHIVLADTGSFRRGRQTPSASVIVRTETAGDSALAPAIRHLVAAAVPGLTVDQVTVLNTDGTILASGGDGTSTAPTRTVSLESAIRKELQDNIAKTLAPYLGLGNFEISVAARLNTDKRQINETNYNPEQRVERSVRVIKETGSSQNSNSKAAVGGEQNVPAEQAASTSGDQSKKNNERREELTNYEVGTKTTSTVSDGYRIEALTVAVLVNRKQLTAALGGDKAPPDAVDRQLKEIERLVSSAAGIDAKRGDRITVSALDFVQGAQSLEPVAGIGVVEHLLRNTSSIVNAIAAVAVVALLIWFGVRPAMRAILEPQPATAAAGGALGTNATPDGAGAIAGGGIAGDSQPNLIADLTSKLERTPLKRLEQMTDFDEEQAAAILKQWMHGARSA